MGFFDALRNGANYLGNKISQGTKFIGQKLSEGADFIGQKIIPNLPNISKVIDDVSNVAELAKPYVNLIPGVGSTLVGFIDGGKAIANEVNGYLKGNAKNDLEQIHNITSKTSDLINKTKFL